MQQVLVCSYSRTITGWLLEKFPGDVALDSSGAGNEEIIAVLQLLLPRIEFQRLTQGRFNLAGRIREVSGLKTKTSQLAWLIRLFTESDLPELVKDDLYDQLKIFVQWKVDPLPAETHGVAIPPVEQNGLSDRRGPAQTGIKNRERITSPFKLSGHQKLAVLDTMKASLAMRYRETDPVSFADADELELFDMGDGLHVAIVSMQKDRRLSLESYIGYMAFRNGTAVAYGGGWIWGQRCRIGISIYPDFRKGGSAWLFSQVLRLFYHYFNVRRFIVRSNQFGKDNPDGLRSGAFWFYYKLGFRPVLADLRSLAREEWRKIHARKSYRSSLKTLSRFVAGPLEWRPDDTPLTLVDAECISATITRNINCDPGRSRRIAIRAAKERVGEKLKPLSWIKRSKHLSLHLQSWLLLIDSLDDFRDWKASEKKRLLELILMKYNGKEREHIVGLQELGVFWRSLARGDWNSMS